ncbi:L-threonine 3-dehydrogenase [Ostreibacterium oceani]|uniref:L-threonine 3-dehydrogenase n=1 Tax=Ostreibacterium oceani TaxID=2654998 RepID=A0A6N7EXT8_9GAMM|nr:L-threonine 3-dehydrogenase [Ostreibacterium oceani]MPV86405.1 L-threonine 3-dehydrogenase [Ostreibacterium oceani]
MKALVKAKSEKGIWMQNVPEPSCGHNDVKIKIKKSAICGTDMHIYQWDKWAQSTIPVPMVVGHEYMGEIVEIGSEVNNLAIGDRVSGEGHIVCGHCRNCLGGKKHLCLNTVGVGVNRPGSFAEYLVIPAENVFKLPAHVSDDVASIFDPFGNAVHTALSFDMVGEDVLITGAGPIGIMAAAICRHAGARFVVVTDVNDYRLELAKNIATNITTVNVANSELKTAMQSLGMVEGFDVGLEMSGVGVALEQMMSNMINGGKIAILGIPPDKIQLDLAHVIFKGLTIKGIYGREMFETWYKMGMLVQSGVAIERVITHHFSIDDYQLAFETMASGQSGKVIMDWN